MAGFTSVRPTRMVSKQAWPSAHGPSLITSSPRTIALASSLKARLIMFACATGFFAYATYKLARREASMVLIYSIVALHGFNVLARGNYPAGVDVVASDERAPWTQRTYEVWEF